MFNQKQKTIMKKNQLRLMAVTFISGIIVGLSAIGLFAFTNAGTAPVSSPEMSKITVLEAQMLYKNYSDKAAPLNEVIKGFAVNKEQLSLLNSLAAENPNLTGYRIYIGRTATGSAGIVVGVNSSGQDVTTSIYRSSLLGSGPCPTLCDATSTITQPQQ